MLNWVHTESAPLAVEEGHLPCSNILKKDFYWHSFVPAKTRLESPNSAGDVYVMADVSAKAKCECTDALNQFNKDADIEPEIPVL